MLRGCGAAATSSVAQPSRREALAASGSVGRGSTHAMAMPGRSAAGSTHAGTCTVAIAGASAGADAAALGTHLRAHAGAHSVQGGASHAPAAREQAAQQEGEALGSHCAAGERAASESRWATFQSCSGKAQGLGSGLQRACADAPGPAECADADRASHSELEGLSVRRKSSMHAAGLRSTRWGGATHHAQACADAAFTTAVD